MQILPRFSLLCGINHALLDHALRDSSLPNLPSGTLTPGGVKHASRPTRWDTPPVYEPKIVEGDESNPSLFRPLFVSSADTGCDPRFHPLPKTLVPTTRPFGWVFA